MVAERILIVGGGIAGLTLHRALAGGPWRVDLVERQAAAEGIGAGLAVQPNAMRALRHLGVAAAVERAGAVIGRFQYRDRRGALLCDIDLGALWAGVGPFVGITRRALHRALRSGPIRAGTAVTAVTPDDDEVVVRFADSTVGRYDLVVGADGLNSVVRRSVGDLPGPVHGGQTAWRSLAPIRPGGLDAVQFWLGADRFFGLCPVGDGTTYGFGNVAGPRLPDPVPGRRRRLRERFADFGGPVREYLAAVPDDRDIHCAPVEWLPDVAYHRGRIVLIGDAAHAMSPMMGQGGCLAIEDAVVLADELRRAATVPAAAAAYAERRRPRVDAVRAHSQALGELVRLPADVRDRALRTGGAAAFADRYRPLIAAP